MATRESASRLGLSRERIVGAAVALFDGEGVDALTMRRLAEELGVGTMTVYGYFRSKEELVDAIVDSGAKRIAEAGGEGSWQERIREFVLELRRSHLAHPAVVEVRLTRPLLSQGALEATERAMSILRGAGFSKRDAARIYRLLFIFAFGFSAFGPPRSGTSDREATRAALSDLPADRFPVLVECLDEASEAMADPTLFEFALDRLIDGIEQMLPEDASA